VWQNLLPNERVLVGTARFRLLTGAGTFLIAAKSRPALGNTHPLTQRLASLPAHCKAMEAPSKPLAAI